jgi:hypothetical protein
MATNHLKTDVEPSSETSFNSRYASDNGQWPSLSQNFTELWLFKFLIIVDMKDLFGLGDNV